MHACRLGAGLGAEIWLSEFGYDTDPASPQAAPSIGPNSNEIVQAQWLLRSVLAIASTGCISRSHQYMLADVETGTPGKYATSGLLTNPGLQPKTAWYWYAALMYYLGDYAFVANATLAGGPRGVCLSAPDGAVAAVVWSPTAANTMLPGFAFSVAACWSTPPAAGLSVVTLVPGSARGIVTPVPLASGAIALNVTETPLIVLQAS